MWLKFSQLSVTNTASNFLYNLKVKLFCSAFCIISSNREYEIRALLAVLLMNDAQDKAFHSSVCVPENHSQGKKYAVQKKKITFWQFRLPANTINLAS